jgi:hypothetical protein
MARGKLRERQRPEYRGDTRGGVFVALNSRLRTPDSLAVGQVCLEHLLTVTVVLGRCANGQFGDKLFQFGLGLPDTALVLGGPLEQPWCADRSRRAPEL